MKDRPIVFSEMMVRPIIAGRKTQTRRLAKPQPIIDRSSGSWVVQHNGGGFKNYLYSWPLDGSVNNVFLAEQCPYGVPGDRLWVKESFWMHDDPNAFDIADGNCVDTDGNHRMIGYAASMDSDAERCARELGARKRPSIHMPRWASRVALEVASVRFERVQDISEEDAIAEGAERNDSPGMTPDWEPEWGYRTLCVHYPDGCECFPNATARDWFVDLWKRINRKHSWRDNPWVWVVEFKAITGAGVKENGK